MNAAKNSWDIDPVKKSITIIQLARFGDLIQTIQITKKIKDQYPEYKIVLIARKEFADPLKFLFKDNFYKIHLLDFNNLFKKGISLEKVSESLNQFIEQINTEQTDVAINLSFSKTSNYILGLLNTKHRVGPYFDHHNQIKIEDKWSQMLYSTVLRGSLNPYSLIDLFSNIIGLSPSKLNPPTINTKTRNSIILHPFASNDRKKWKISKWAETIYKLLAQNHTVKIKLVGSESDLQESIKLITNPILEKFSHRISNLVGKTTIQSLYNLLDDKSLFVGHDSMVGHLASLKNVQTLTVSLGNVRAIETTPLGLNNYNITPKTNCYPCFPTDKCDYYQCHTDMPYQSVAAAISSLVTSGEITNEVMEKNCSSFLLTPIKILKSSLSSSHYLKMDNILDSPQSLEDSYRLFYRISWLYLFNEVEENNEYPKVNTRTLSDLKFNTNGLQHMFELAEFGKKYSRYILEEVASDSPAINKIKEYSKKIDEIDQLSNLISDTYPMLAPIVDFSRIAKANMYGDNLVRLTESSFMIYDQISFLASTIYELSKKTIDEVVINKNQSQPDKRGI